ncbi:MAG: HPr family phosphocarrier protein [Clostridia bacterium]|nr:HPr family phosphocarrier protein [Clostridia bacterium]
MKTFMIKLSTLEDVRKFVNTVTAFDGDIDLKSGRYTVDAKSIMGIFSLDLLSPVEMTIHCDNCDEIVKKLDSYIIK